MKTQLPIDSSGLTFIAVIPPEPVLDRKTEQQEADANGEPLYSIELVCIGADGDEILSVKFPGTPPAGIRQGMPVKVTGLMVTDRAIGDRFGVGVPGYQGRAAVGRGRRDWPSSPAVGATGLSR